MPLVDLPIEQLRAYSGRNPAPSDHDEYWERAIAEVDAIAPNAEFIPSEFKVPGVECFDLYFTGTQGARIHARHVRPSNQTKPSPAILEFHGYTMYASDWSEMLKWAGIGFSFFSLDVRGQGGTSQDVGGAIGPTYSGHISRGMEGHEDLLFYRQVYLDTLLLARIAASTPGVDGKRMGTIGYSQGGALALVCASLYPDIARCVSVYPYLSDYRRVWEMDLAKDAYQDLRDYIRRFDPRHERIDAIFEKLGYIDVQHLAHRIQAEVLMGTGLMDTICPPSTQFAAYNRITSPKRMAVYPDFGHEGLRGFGDIAFQFLAGLV